MNIDESQRETLCWRASRPKIYLQVRSNNLNDCTFDLGVSLNIGVMFELQSYFARQISSELLPKGRSPEVVLTLADDWDFLERAHVHVLLAYFRPAIFRSFGFSSARFFCINFQCSLAIGGSIILPGIGLQPSRLTSHFCSTTACAEALATSKKVYPSH